MIFKEKEYKVKNKRLAKYLYSLGFDRKSVISEGEEYWIFASGALLSEALDFYFYMRKANRS